MGIDKKFSTHISNVIKRQISNKFRDIELIFILHEEKGREAAVTRDTRMILKNQGGQIVLDYLRKPSSREFDDERTRLMGMSSFKKKNAPFLASKYNFLAIFFINTDRIDSEFTFRSQLLHLTWHALALRKDFLRRNEPALSLNSKSIFNGEDTYETKDGIIKAKLNTETATNRNLMADVFAASFQFLEGDSDAIKNMAVMRMRETLIAKDGYIAERYPYAVCADTLDFIFDQNTRILNKKDYNIDQSLEIAEDIGKNYSIPSIPYWKSFSHPAQHMAWIGFNQEIILGASVYTSENSYVRAIGDLVVKYAHIEPDIITTLDEFNPFLSLVNAEMMHKKLCYDTYRLLLLNKTSHEDSNIIYEEVQKQNFRLQMGNPHGWCVHTLLSFAEKFKNEYLGGNNKEKDSKAETFFESAQSEIPYEILLKFSVLIFQKRRAGAEIKFEEMKKLALGNKEFTAIGVALEKAEILVHQSN